jgi:hypothetical protein
MEPLLGATLGWPHLTGRLRFAEATALAAVVSEQSPERVDAAVAALGIFATDTGSAFGEWFGYWFGGR